jgi:hypothetical protein
MEYLVDSMAVAAELSSQLNGGQETRPWQLQSLATGTTSLSAGSRFRGIWHARLSDLKR